MPYRLFDKTEKLPSAKKILKPLAKLGIKTINDLLYHIPFRYEDFSSIVPIKFVKAGNRYAIAGRILSVENQWTWRRKFSLTKALVGDESGEILAIWFNQPYLKNSLKENSSVLLLGKAAVGTDGLHLQNPLYEKNNGGEESVKFFPVYPLTKGITSRWLRYLIKIIFNQGVAIEEFLPKEIIRRVSLLPLNQVLRNVHFPLSLASAEKAKQRIIFDKIFLNQLRVLKEKQKLLNQRSFVVPFKTDILKKFVFQLSFKLTDCQRKAIFEIATDMSLPAPMSRLLNGDVGSGKTVVAAAVSLLVADAGGQVALMAPTEILAKQHFEIFSKLLKDFKIPIGLMTSSGGKVVGSQASDKKSFLKEISGGRIKILIGTHSLIQKSTRFNNLVLVVIDEQHRFGVAQRAALVKKENILIPHFLSMSATPIPRTLTLTLYGDLNISVLDELPPARQKIITKAVLPAKRHEIYEFIRKEIKSGRQAFIICPRIKIEMEEETENYFDFEKVEIKAVEKEYENLKIVFPELKIAKLHGQLKNKVKEETMVKFKNRVYDILVTTSLVEVGVDVPNASIMVVENAQRFGLAQLHQIRGRVGRGPHQSYCFLFTGSESKKINIRLETMIKAKNGFELAEYDLKLRGPGDFFGTRQWGEPANDFLSDSLFDLKLVEAAHREAKALLKKDFELKIYSEIRSRLENLESLIHYE